MDVRKVISFDDCYDGIRIRASAHVMAREKEKASALLGVCCYGSLQKLSLLFFIGVSFWKRVVAFLVALGEQDQYRLVLYMIVYIMALGERRERASSFDVHAPIREHNLVMLSSLVNDIFI